MAPAAPLWEWPQVSVGCVAGAGRPSTSAGSHATCLSMRCHQRGLAGRRAGPAQKDWGGPRCSPDHWALAGALAKPAPRKLNRTSWSFLLSSVPPEDRAGWAPSQARIFHPRMEGNWADVLSLGLILPTSASRCSHDFRNHFVLADISS